MLNQPVPYFELPSTGNETFRLSAAPGKTLLIYFYPKDNTPGCTTEGQQFSDAYASHTKLAPPPVRAKCLAQQGVSKHERGGNCGF